MPWNPDGTRKKSSLYKKKAKGKRGYTMLCKKCGKAKSKCTC